MKRNALIRIILWSVALVVLVSIFGVLLNQATLDRIEGRRIELERAPTELLVTSPVESAAAVPVETTVASSLGKFSATEAVIVRTSPSTEASVIGMVYPNDIVTLSRRESVSGTSWGYITDPEGGWVQMEYFVEVETPVQETVVSYADAEPGDKHIFSAGSISELEIEWVAGDILIQPGNTDQITVREDGVSDSKYAMLLQQRGEKLKIAFCEENAANIIGFGSTNELVKDLTITVPVDWVCESLDIDCASATLEVNDMTIREVDFDGASGTCEFENCTVEEMDIDTASGDVKFIGSLDTLDYDAASASVYAVLSNVPRRLAMDSMSGDLDITLPDGAGFSLALNGMSTDFESDFDTTMKNGNYVCGDGSCRINVDAMSGDVVIRKGEASAAPETPTAP